MKKSILMMLGMAFLPVMALAAPDFNGTWVRDNAKSDRDSYPLCRLTRGVYAGTGQPNAEFVVSVRQDAKGVQVTDSVHTQRNYVLDGKPLTITLTREVPASKQTIKQVFARK